MMGSLTAKAQPGKHWKVIFAERECRRQRPTQTSSTPSENLCDGKFPSLFLFALIGIQQ